jgi:hypothetical protein
VLERFSEIGGERGIGLDRDEGVRSELEQPSSRLTCAGADLESASLRPGAAALDENLVDALRVARAGGVIPGRIQAEESPPFFAIDPRHG